MHTGNLIFIVLTLISFVGLFKVFTKSGVPVWKVLVPFLNFYELLKILERLWWWILLMIVPGVNILMYCVFSFHLARHFGKRDTTNLIVASIIPFLYIPYLGFSSSEKITGINDIKNLQGGFVKNWLDPLLFAVIAATVIRTLFLKAYTIPSSS